MLREKTGGTQSPRQTGEHRVPALPAVTRPEEQLCLLRLWRDNAGRDGLAAQAPSTSLMTWVAFSPFMLEETRRGFEEKWHKPLV